MSPCRTFKYRDRIDNACNLFEELADDLRHGNEPDWECMAELGYQLNLLSNMIEADCAELEWEEEKKCNAEFEWMQQLNNLSAQLDDVK